MSDTERTLNDLLRFAKPDDVMTGTVKAMLMAGAGNARLAVLTEHDGLAMATFLSDAVPGLADACDLLELADKIIGLLAKAIRTAGDTASAAPSLPSNITLVAPPPPMRREDMKLPQLLAELAAHPEDAGELLHLIRATDLVRRAEIKLTGGREWAIVIDGTLSIEETVAYVTQLAATYSRVPRKWRGQHWPTTLERALGIERRVMLYPFPTKDDPREVLLEGLDPYDRDWATLPDVVHEAILWGVLTDHRNLKGNTNYRQLTDDLFADELPPYLAEIVEDYKHAKANPSARHHAEAKMMTRYADEDTLRRVEAEVAAMGQGRPGGRHPFGGEPEPVRDDAWYLAQLRGVARRAIDELNQSVAYGPVVVQSIRTVNGAIQLDGTLVLGDIRSTNGAIRGTAFVLAGSRVRSTNGRVSQEIIDATPKQLYAKAVELGLITP